MASQGLHIYYFKTL